MLYLCSDAIKKMNQFPKNRQSFSIFVKIMTMETDKVSVIKMPIGFIVLKMNLLGWTIRYYYAGNNFHNEGNTDVSGDYEIDIAVI